MRTQLAGTYIMDHIESQYDLSIVVPIDIWNIIFNYIQPLDFKNVLCCKLFERLVSEIARTVYELLPSAKILQSNYLKGKYKVVSPIKDIERYYAVESLQAHLVKNYPGMRDVAPVSKYEQYDNPWTLLNIQSMKSEFQHNHCLQLMYDETPFRPFSISMTTLTEQNITGIRLLLSLTCIRLYNAKINIQFIAQVSQLERLSMSNCNICDTNGICFIDFEKLVNLYQLEISVSQMTKIPKELYSLKKLTVLVIRHTQITSVPDKMCNLLNLSYLDLSYNQIKSVSMKFLRNTNVCYIDFEGNPLFKNYIGGKNLHNYREFNLRKNGF